MCERRTRAPHTEHRQTLPDLPPETPSADWLKPPEEQEGLKRYVETFRERLRLILITIAITTGVAILYVLAATKTYEAEAELLVTPVSGNDPVLASLGLIGVSADPTRDVETASRLVTNLNVAEAVKKQLRSSLEPSSLLGKVTAIPVAQSNIVAVTATETSPEEAKRLADAFANQAVKTRTESLHEQIDRQLPVLRAELGSQGSTGAGEESLAGQVAQLQLLASGPTPDMRVETEAALPTAQSSPRVTLSIAAGILAGLILGIVAAFTAQVLDPRLRREAQLRRLYRLPILGRIPKDSHANASPLLPRQLSAATSEAYRTLRTTLTAGQSGGRVILVTGSGSSEGKSTTAMNLATSIALSGKRVALIESDLRKPALGKALDVKPQHGGIVGVLLENVEFEDALMQADLYGPNLQLLLADYEGGWIAELFSLAAAQRMIEEARQMADYVIIDSPPLNEVVDALPLAQLADSVLIVAKLGRTRLDKLAHLGELLAENGVRPAGFAVVGVPQPGRNQYPYHRARSATAGDSGHSLLGRRRT
jgi:capsular exopolysaccharide synthesis family protein